MRSTGVCVCVSVITCKREIESEDNKKKYKRLYCAKKVNEKTTSEKEIVECATKIAF